MSKPSTHPQEKYQPRMIKVPELYTWPPRPMKIARFLLLDLLYPWGLIYLLLAFPTWWFLTPSLETMAHLEPGWIGLLWLRNCGFLVLFAGGLHWYLHKSKSQGEAYLLNRKPLPSHNPVFLWGDQIKDNMFWSIASGVSVWTAFEAITYWVYASGTLPIVENPWYFVGCFYLLFFWSTANFYAVHRALHFRPLYRYAHELHHRNVEVGPWSGIAMHPLEHLVYFTPFILWWLIPVHPVIVILTGFYQGLNPALSHCGYDYVKIGKLKLKTGDWFHQLHHQYFNLNYGNIPTPFDKLFDSWHDGSKASLKKQKQRLKAARAEGR